MKIGVSGASGQLGKVVVAELVRLGSGHDVVAISRTPQSGAAGIEGRHGDYDQPETLKDAYRGLDRLLLIPSADMRPGVRGRQFKAAIDAAVEEGVGHIVVVSTAGTREAVEPSMFAAYWDAEQHLMRVARQWTILRMNFYAESFAQFVPMSLGSGVLTGVGEGNVAFVSRDDVGAAAAGILLGKGKPGAIYNATGPVALSGSARAAVIAEVTGKPMSFVILDEEQLRAGMTSASVPEPLVNAMIEIETKFAEGSFDVVTGDVEKLGGRKPRSLQEVLRVALSQG
ncbi:SDR family oxidoreductase [Pseudaminobacter sp. NGMCC 1.201702]|uniref:SDR family oxidoreductase n=1 Tax=Pseudaminobacter sp. NGMCC 1.201702 TaxID=3391825 RepID=UPI0039EE3C45